MDDAQFSTRSRISPGSTRLYDTWCDALAANVAYAQKLRDAGNRRAGASSSSSPMARTAARSGALATAPRFRAICSHRAVHPRVRRRGNDVDFRAVARSMGVPDGRIAVQANATPAAMRKVFGMVKSPPSARARESFGLDPIRAFLVLRTLIYRHGANEERAPNEEEEEFLEHYRPAPSRAHRRRSTRRLHRHRQAAPVLLVRRNEHPFKGRWPSWRLRARHRRPQRIRARTRRGGRTASSSRRRGSPIPPPRASFSSRSAPSPGARPAHARHQRGVLRACAPDACTDDQGRRRRLAAEVDRA